MVNTNIENEIEVDLPEDECEDLELSLKPEFVVPMLRLAEAFETVEIEWDEIESVEHFSAFAP